MRAITYVCAAVGALVAIFVGLLASVDLSTPADSRPLADLGSGAMFDSIADAYDVTNKVLSLGSDVAWRRALVAALELDQVVGRSAHALDLATGTADVAIALASSPPQPIVTGVDPSANMLAHGRTKVAALGLAGQVTLHQGDAQHLKGHAANAYDSTCAAFGVRNVPDRVKALREMARVTKPRGVVAVLEFSAPSEGWLAPLAKLFVAHVVPRLGALMSGGARAEYVHLQQSIADFPLPADFRAEMTAAGLLGVQSRLLHPGGVYLYTSRAP